MTSSFVLPALIFTVVIASMVYIDRGLPGAARFALLIDTLFSKLEGLIPSRKGGYGGGHDSDGTCDGGWDGGD